MDSCRMRWVERLGHGASEEIVRYQDCLHVKLRSSLSHYDIDWKSNKYKTYCMPYLS